MDIPDLLALFVAPIDQAGVPYMIVGSVASIQYGEPRFTTDVDLTISLSTTRAHELTRLYPEPDFYCPPLDVLLVELQRPERAHFNVIHIPSGMKADFYPTHRQAYHQWALENLQLVEIGQRTYRFAPPENVILWKLIYFREGRSEKHLRDIASMLEVQGPAINQALLETATAELRLTQEWQEAKARVAGNR